MRWQTLKRYERDLWRSVVMTDPVLQIRNANILIRVLLIVVAMIDALT